MYGINDKLTYYITKTSNVCPFNFVLEFDHLFHCSNFASFQHLKFPIYHLLPYIHQNFSMNIKVLSVEFKYNCFYFLSKSVSHIVPCLRCFLFSFPFLSSFSYAEVSLHWSNMIYHIHSFSNLLS